MSKFRHNFSYMYRYKWSFVSIEMLWPTLKLEKLTFVSIQTRDVSIQTSESWNLDWYVSKHASMLRIILSFLDFENKQLCIDTCKHASIHRSCSVSERPLLYRYRPCMYRYKMLKIKQKRFQDICIDTPMYVSIQNT